MMVHEEKEGRVKNNQPIEIYLTVFPIKISKLLG